MPKYPEPVEVEESPSAETKVRHETDMFIRAHGWKIISRAPGQQPRWEKRGQVLSQSAVLRAIHDKLKDKLRR